MPRKPSVPKAKANTNAPLPTTDEMEVSQAAGADDESLLSDGPVYKVPIYEKYPVGSVVMVNTANGPALMSVRGNQPFHPHSLLLTPAPDAVMEQCVAVLDVMVDDTLPVIPIE